MLVLTVAVTAAGLLARGVVEALVAILPQRRDSDFQALFAAELLDVVEGQAFIHQNGDSTFQFIEHFSDARRNATMFLAGKRLGGADDRFVFVHLRPPFLCGIPPRNPESKLACVEIIA